MAMTTTATRIENYDMRSNTCTGTMNKISVEEATIQSTLMKTTDTLKDIESMVDEIIRFIFSNDSANNGNDIEIVSMATNIVCNMDIANRIKDKLKDLASRLGC